MFLLYSPPFKNILIRCNLDIYIAKAKISFLCDNVYRVYEDIVYLRKFAYLQYWVEFQCYVWQIMDII